MMLSARFGAYAASADSSAWASSRSEISHFSLNADWTASKVFPCFDLDHGCSNPRGA
jgi:hypothetical protein